jgi:uncharacterized protein
MIQKLTKAMPIMASVTGSRLYGNSRPQSDWDFRGVVISPPSKYFGIAEADTEAKGKGTYENLTQIDLSAFSPEQVAAMEGEDIQFYDIRKFFQMATKANPNIVELLFCDDNLVGNNPMWQRVRDNRHLFLSQRAKHSFSGYAHAQLKRIVNHKDWVDVHPTDPKREDYGLPPKSQYSNAKIKALRQFSDEELERQFANNTELANFKREFAWFEAKQKYLAYLKHKAERNEARCELEAKFGYDTKHASHLVRLFYEAQRLMKTGELIFPLPEIDIISAVRDGAWSYEKLMEFADNMDANLQAIVDEGDCILPHSPDREPLNELVQEIIWDHLKKVLD